MLQPRADSPTRSLMPSHRSLADALMALSPDAILVTDHNGWIEAVGGAVEAVTGHAVEALVGRSVALLMTGDDRALHDGYMARWLAERDETRLAQERTVRLLHRDGRVLPVQVRLALMGDPARPRFVAVLRDLSDKREADAREGALRDALHHSARVSSMGELATGLAHEVNQPLTAIQQYLGSLLFLIDQGKAGDKEVRDLAAKALEQVERSARIVRSLRRFVQQDAPRPQPEQLAVLVRETLALSLQEAERARMSISIDVPDTLPAVMVEAVPVQQVLHNLVRNAVTALRDVSAPQLVIRAGVVEPDTVAVSVEDNGPGISPDLKGRLFDRFVSGTPGGMGLGLALCRSIIAGQGGEIGVSDRDGGGACFRFTLPVATS